MIYFDLFLTFLKIGLFTFGGGYAMLPMIQEEVSAHSWLNQSELIDFIAVSESTPGPFAVNIATFVGTRTGGIFGGLCATFGVVLPSFVIILFVARFYQRFKSSKLVAGAMNGLKPANTAVFSTAQFYVSLGIFAVAVVLAFKKFHPILIILLSAVIGVIAGMIGTA